MDVKWERTVMARRHRIFAIVSIILLLILILISFRENTQEWMGYQKEYYRRIAVRLNDPEFLNKPLKVEQIWLTQLKTTDRCTTCHLGVNNPLFTDEDQPFRTHPGDLLKTHPIEKYGCTVCHQGDGQAVTVEATHGTVHHLNRQLLVGDFVQVSCVKCHVDLHDPSVTAEDFPAPTFFEGRRLSFQFGCRACHNINGEGGILGPELTGFGSKTELAFYLLHYFDYVEGPHTMAQWEYEHFLDPQKIQPGNPELNIPPTVMPNFGISPEQAEALTIYMISLRDSKVDAIPYEYISKKRLAKSN